jgi:hypothetical protein
MARNLRTGAADKNFIRDVWAAARPSIYELLVHTLIGVFVFAAIAGTVALIEFSRTHLGLSPDSFIVTIIRWSETALIILDFLVLLAFLIRVTSIYLKTLTSPRIRRVWTERDEL